MRLREKPQVGAQIGSFRHRRESAIFAGDLEHAVQRDVFDDVELGSVFWGVNTRISTSSDVCRLPQQLALS